MDTEFHLGTGSDAPERPQIKCARIGATRRYLRAGEFPSVSRTAKTVAQTLVEPRLRPRTTIAASSRAAIPAGSSEIRAVLCVAVHPFRYLSGGTHGGPPLRMIIDSGIHVGAGSDSAQISTLNPWNMIYYMVTGKNVAGKLVNGGQQITREEAIRLYTVNNGWFLKEEAKLGSIEVGKLGDVVVLSDDYFNPVRVPDESIRKLHPVLTIVDGKVVYSSLGQ